MRIVSVSDGPRYFGMDTSVGFFTAWATPLSALATGCAIVEGGGGREGERSKSKFGEVQVWKDIIVLGNPPNEAGGSTRYTKRRQRSVQKSVQNQVVNIGFLLARLCSLWASPVRLFIIRPSANKSTGEVIGATLC